MNRRTFISTGASAAAGAAVLGQIGCGKSIANEIAIIISTVGELKPLLPNQAAILDTIAKAATDFNAAYSKGDFDSARNFFDSLADNISTLMADIGVDNPHISFLVALISIAVHAVAALLNSQATPKLAARARGAAPRTADRVTSMSSPATAGKVLNSLKF